MISIELNDFEEVSSNDGIIYLTFDADSVSAPAKKELYAAYRRHIARIPENRGEDIRFHDGQLVSSGVVIRFAGIDFKPDRIAMLEKNGDVSWMVPV